jgi:hypothetical protein
MTDAARLQLIDDHRNLAELRERAARAEREGDPSAEQLMRRADLASRVLAVHEGMPISQEVTGSGGPFGEAGMRQTIMATTAPGEKLSNLAEGRHAKIEPSIGYNHPNIVDLRLCWNSTAPRDANADRDTIAAIYAAGKRPHGPLASMLDERVLVCVDLDDALAAAKAWIASAVIVDSAAVARYPHANRHQLRTPPRTLADCGL